MPAPEVGIRPLRPDDVEGAYAVARGALFAPPAGEDEAQLHARQVDRIAHLQDTDPGGSWVAERDGRVVGVAQALLREGVWGCSLFAVDEDLQGRGVGRRLLDAALRHGDGARGWIVLSTGRPAAMRRYARAGLDLRPRRGCGRPGRRDADPRRGRPRGGRGRGRAGGGRRHRTGGPRCRPRSRPALLAAARRASAGPRGPRLRAPRAHGAVALLGARDEAAAQTALWGAFARAPRGATVSVDFLTAGQQWAIRPCRSTRACCSSPDSPVFLRGDVGPFAPYVPSGAWL